MAQDKNKQKLIDKARAGIVTWTIALLLAPLAMLVGLGRAAHGAKPTPGGRITNPSYNERQSATSRAAPLPSSYVELYRQVVARHSPEKHYTLFETVSLGEASLRLWRRTKEPAYLATAKRCFETALAQGKPDLRDFHLLMAFARLALLLKQEGHVRPDLDAEVREIAENQLRAFIRSPENGDYNIRIAQVLAYASLLQYLDGTAYADREAARKRLEEYWSLVRQTGDLDEDATNYDSLGMALLVDLARLTGREDDLKRSAGFRRVFERFRDIVSPTGLVPEYGDSYFSTSACLLDRVYLLEYAAKLYDDPTFLHVARKLYPRPGSEFPGVDSWFRGLGLIELEAGSKERRGESREGESREPAVSLVTMRMRRGEPQPLVDKLILRTGLEPGAAMVMMDLYASGSHAHLEKGPSIAYFEADGVPLFHNMGRHGTASAITGNLLWAMPGKDRFPGCWNRADEWFTMAIPTQYLTREGDRYVVAPVMLLRNFQERSRSCSELFFDNLRLEGPAGTRLVDGFEDPTRWDARLRKVTRVRLAKESSQGPFCEGVLWKPVPSGHVARKLASPPERSFSRDEYPYLKLDVKYHGSRPTMHIRGLGRQVDLGDQLLASQLIRARAEQQARDAYGEVIYGGYITSDTSLTRRLVLTAEGCLVVYDVFVPGPSMKGWNAGQLWQMYDQRSLPGQAGRNWFLSDDDGPYPAADGSAKTRRMLVRFAAGRPVTVGSEEIRQNYHCPSPKERKPERFFTTYSRALVTPGRKEYFAMIVVPQDPAVSGDADPAAGVAIAMESDGTAVAGVRARDGHRLEVHVGEAAWGVTHRP